MITFTKVFLLCVLLFSCSARNADYEKLVDVKKIVTAENTPDSSGTVAVGSGYSEDSEQVTQQQCFRATVSSISEREGKIKLDQATSFADLENVLRVKVSVGGGFWKFSGKATANYMRSIQDKDYSMSLNYFASFSNKVTVNIQGYGMNALTEFGKGTYNDSGNPYFGLVCGDYYVASYDQGALLTMSLNVELSSHEEKKEFTKQVSFGFGNIFKAATRIEEVSKKNKISGTVSVRALQIGGEPTQLTDILNSNVVRCNITDLVDCLKTTSTLLEYAKNFGKQIKNGTGFEPLGTATYHSIRWLGLTPPKSLVTTEISQYRHELLRKLRESEYYKQKFYSFLQGYPVELTDIFVEKANSILAKADNNVRVLMDQDDGAARCFDEPDRCKQTRDRIYSQLQTVSIEDLKFLKDVKYTLVVPYGEFYNSGGELETSWKCKVRDATNKVSVESVYITDKYYSYALNVAKYDTRILFNGVWNPAREGYVGTQTIIKSSQNATQEITHPKRLSPFFFEDYTSLL